MSPATKDRIVRLPFRPWVWFAVALAVRLVYLVEQGATSVLFYQPLLDEQELAATAEALLRGEGFGAEPLFKAPLYPLLLAITMAVAGEGWFWAIRLLHHLAGALVAAMAADAAGRLLAPGRGRRVAIVLAGAGVAIYGPLIRLENRLLLDSLVVFLQSAMLWALVRMRVERAGRALRWAALAGLLAALAWLTRPTITPVLPLVTLWIVGARWRPATWRAPSGRRRLAVAGLFVLVPVLAMGAVAARNLMAGGEALVLPWQGGFSLYEANRRGASGRYFAQRNFAMTGTADPNPARRLAVEQFGEGMGLETAEAWAMPRGEIDRFWKRRTLAEIGGDPLAWLGLMARKGFYLASEREIFNIEDYGVQRAQSAVLSWMPVSFGVVWPLALASLALLPVWARGRRRLAGLMWLYAAGLGAAIALYYVSGRLRMPLVFPAAVLGAAGVGRFCTWDSKAVAPRRALAFQGGMIVLLAVGIFWSWGDWWGVRSEDVRPYEYARLSGAAYLQGKHALALDYAQRLAELRPNYPQAPQLAGQALYRLGRYEPAAQAFAESMRRLPDDPVAPYNLAVYYYHRTDEIETALALFEESWRRQPSYHRAAWASALALIRLGRLEAARARLEPYLRGDLEGAPAELLVAAIALALAEGNEARAKYLTARLEETAGETGLGLLRVELETIRGGGEGSEPQ